MALKVTVTNLATAAVAVFLSTTAPAIGATDPKIPNYYVIFRPNGAVTFHLGAHAVGIEPYNLRDHHVKIEDAATGAVVFDKDLENHWWNSQWSYRPGPITIIKSPAQIVAENRMFIFGRVPGMKESPAFTRSPPGNAAMPYYWVTTYMPTTGERRDLGLVSDDGAQAMMGKQTQGLIDGAIAGGTAPIHYRDGGRIIDVSKKAYNHYSLKGYQPGEWIDPGPPIPPSGPDPTAPGYDRGSDGWHVQGGGNWAVQIAHLAELSYLAHKFTNDPIFLEDLQYMAEFAAIGDDGVWSGPDRNQPPPIPTSEYRGEAWLGRTLVMAWIATKDAEAAGTLPASCNPSSSFKPVIDAIRDRYLKVVNNPDKNIQAFRLLNGAGRFGPWQQEYNMLFLSFTQLVGMKDWEPIYLWALKNTIDRTIATRGWPTGYGGAYYLNTVRGGGEPDWPDADSQKRNLGIDPPIPKPADFGKKFETWAEVFEDMHLYGRVSGAPSGLLDAQYQALLKDPLFGGGLVNVTGRGYTQNTHAVLAAAAYLDYKKLVAVKALYPELDTCIANVERQLAGDEFGPRASIVNDPTAPPIVVTPLPPVTELPPVENPPTNPPTGGTMTDFIQGVTVPLYLKPDGKIYGVPKITTLPAGQINVTQMAGPDAGGVYTGSFTPVVDTTEEEFSISAFCQTDPTDATKGYTKTFSGKDVRKPATPEGTVFGVVRPG